MTAGRSASSDRGAAPLLAVQGLRRCFRHRDREVVAVHGATLTVDTGETVGLVGPSGAGKSTLARMITGLTRPDAGTVVYRGRELTGLTARRGRRHGPGPQMIFQDPYAALAPGLTVAELVAEPLAIHTSDPPKERRRRALAALEEVRLTPADGFADRHPHELSGGERQRVALARALLLRPPLVVADEPTQMLDAALRTALLDLMRDLQAAHGTAYLYVTHNLALAQSLCDRLVVMDRGRIVEAGPTRTVLGSPEHARTAALVEAVRRLQRPLERSAP